MRQLPSVALACLLIASCQSEAENVRARWSPELWAHLSALAGGDCPKSEGLSCEGPNGSFNVTRHDDGKLDWVSFKFTTADVTTARAKITDTLRRLNLSRAAMDGFFARFKLPGHSTMSTPVEHVEATATQGRDTFMVSVSVWWYR